VKNKKTIIISTLFTIILLAILIANVQFSEVVESIKKVKFIYILPAFVFHLMAFVFRSLSYYLVTADKKKVSFVELFSAHLIHNFYLHIIPANLGELSFPLLLKNKLKTEESLSMLFISRFVSMIVTVLLFFLSLFFVFQWKNSFVFNIQLYSVIILFLSLIGFFVFRFRTKIVALLSRNSFVKRIIAKIISLIESVKNDILKFKHISFALIYMITISISILSVSVFYLFLLLGMGMEITFFQVVFVSSIGVAFVLLPIKSIGGFGTTEGAWTVGLMLIGLSKEISITAGFVVHIYALINVLIIFCIGIIINYLIKNKNIYRN